MANAKKFVDETLLEISKSVNEKYKKTQIIRVVRWIVDGEVKSPSVEKREWYLDKNQEERNKAVAFTVTEFKMLLNKKDAILAILENPPAYKAPEGVEADAIEEVPF